MPINPRLDFSIDLHKSTLDVVNELRARLKELEWWLVHNQAFASYAIDECLYNVTDENNEFLSLDSIFHVGSSAASILSVLRMFIGTFPCTE